MPFVHTDQKKTSRETGFSNCFEQAETRLTKDIIVCCTGNDDVRHVGRISFVPSSEDLS